jgi:hypothetical protein
MAKAKKMVPVVSDLSAEVSQSACDKLLGSVSYPFTAIEIRRDFPKPRGALRTAVGGYEYSDAEAKKLLTSALDYVQNRQGNMDPAVAVEVYSGAASIIEQAEKVIAASGSKKRGPPYKGPKTGELQQIVDGGITKLTETLRGDFGITGWCPYLQVVIKQEPRLTLASPRIDLSGVTLEVTATGELWIKHPWWNCYKWCTQWEKIIKWERLASITVSVRIQAAVHANLTVNGAEVSAYGEFDRLRLGGDIFDKIPLEGIANEVLGHKPVFVYDASKLVQTVPILGSKFSVSSVSLPANPSGISVGVNIKQVK